MTDSKPPSLTGINHLAFITPDLPATIRFYRDLLGMTLVAGVGHDGYQHYFFRVGAAQVAFFQYDGASAMVPKFPGERTGEPIGFDHLSLNVDTYEDLLYFRAKLEAADINVHGIVDHGVLWSIYFYDPVNNIPLEISWDCMELVEIPAIVDDVDIPVALEGAHAQPGHWPDPAVPIPKHLPKAGNAYRLRDALEADGRAVSKPKLKELLASLDSSKS